jgi:hypothetical protein
VNFGYVFDICHGITCESLSQFTLGANFKHDVSVLECVQSRQGRNMLEHVSCRPAGRPHGQDSFAVRVSSASVSRKIPQVIVKMISLRVGVDCLIGDNLDGHLSSLIPVGDY